MLLNLATITKGETVEINCLWRLHKLSWASNIIILTNIIRSFQAFNLMNLSWRVVDSRRTIKKVFKLMTSSEVWRTIDDIIEVFRIYTSKYFIGVLLLYSTPVHLYAPTSFPPPPLRLSPFPHLPLFTPQAFFTHPLFTLRLYFLFPTSLLLLHYTFTPVLFYANNHSFSHPLCKSRPPSLVHHGVNTLPWGVKWFNTFYSKYNTFCVVTLPLARIQKKIPFSRINRWPPTLDLLPIY